MKNLLKMQQRLKGGQSRSRGSLPKSQPADLMAKQAELVKAQQARRAATAKAPPKGSLNPIKQRMQKNRMQRMAKGGMTKGYAKGGMANCGASVKPNGGKKGT